MSIVSPCVKLCAIETSSGLCAGCQRTMDEIRRWSSMSHDERLQVMEALPERRMTDTDSMDVA
ncbi:DUF1289 domain-containing protein [Coralliovum pocilloporae]|uniref:DUF1289 domain-containing protein n=1 Tax=Coralliovum pocilloporae TaxID=3066369 RepID=UPI0033069F81